jgi:DNA modification methylase
MFNGIVGRFEEIDASTLPEIDLVFMDPPDNEGRAYGKFNDKMDDEAYRYLLNTWVMKACGITDGPVFVSIAEKWMSVLEGLIDYKAVRFVRRIIWHYTFGQNSKHSYSPCFRPIYWLNNDTIFPENIKIPSARQAKYGDKRANSDGKMPSNVWEFSRVCGTFKERRKWHPTQHPEALLERIILGHTVKGQIVLDPFVGSGTTALVCQATERKCIGIDQNPQYVEKVYDELDARKSND